MKLGHSLLRTLILSLAVASATGPAFAQANAKAAPKRKRPAKVAWEITKMPKDQVICMALYTVHKGVLKLTAQLYELDADADRTVRLEIKKGGKWAEIARTKAIERGWTAPFRVENWDATKDHEYRVCQGDSAFYTGRIRKDPVDKAEIVVAAFTGNSNQDRGPRPDLIDNLKKQDPDVLFFSGDQVYDHGKHFPSWLQFGRQFHEVIRDRPTITIPDDHDVGNGNLWGAGGKVGPDGYKDPEFIKEVERAQTSHLPDPVDPAPIERGIGVYYTALTWGRVGFAVIEDRKFKSQTDILDRDKLPGATFSRADHVKAIDDPKTLDVPGAKLLGDRQLKFLREWSADWTSQDMKAVLSQTVFAGAAHLHGGAGNRLLIDLDCNGWPQSGRNRALGEIRRGFALMIGGDQHLATVIHHGIDGFDDAGWSFCVPSIVNYYNRWWLPLQPAVEPVKTPLPHTGKFLDGLGNHITLYAYANPDPDRPKYGKWGARAAGHGIVRFNKQTRKITIECWPRGCEVDNPEHKQYPGWPVTIDQLDNYGRKAAAWLPTLEVSGQADPVVQVIDESGGEVIYTVRIHGTSFRAKVFAEGTYTVKVGEGGHVKTLKGVKSVGADSKETLKVSL